jgi:hypothetical protein
MAKIKTFDVDVCRIGYGNRTIRVQATTAKKAERLAEDEAGSVEFSEHTAKYESQGASEVK